MNKEIEVKNIFKQYKGLTAYIVGAWIVVLAFISITRFSLKDE